jgi:hypothetical protein
MSDFNIYRVSATIEIRDTLAGDAEAVETILKGKGYRYDVIDPGYVYRVKNEITVAMTESDAVTMFTDCLQSQFPALMRNIAVPHQSSQRSFGVRSLDLTLKNVVSEGECTLLAPYSEEVYSKIEQMGIREWIAMKRNARRARELGKVTSAPHFPSLALAQAEAERLTRLEM